MKVYRSGDPKIQIKADKTPVTEADLLANDILVQGLKNVNSRDTGCFRGVGRNPLCTTQKNGNGTGLSIH